MSVRRTGERSQEPQLSRTLCPFDRLRANGIEHEPRPEILRSAQNDKER
jgi:hypothetical protein